METFRHLSDENIVHEKLVDAVERRLGFRTLTPVQSASIPRLLNYQDVAVQACTGSGKTLAYLLPVYELLCRSEKKPFKGVGALIVSPTRELAGQIFEVSNVFSEATGKVIEGGGRED